jgi:hypothetical protein
MWKCAKCGHKSGTKRTSSYGCDHEWWDENELERAREQARQKQRQREQKQEQERQKRIQEQKQEQLRKKQMQQAEIDRKIIAFNYELQNTEDGQKKLKGEYGWQWIEKDYELFEKNYLPSDGDKAIKILWLKSNFGKSWLKSENGQRFANHLRERAEKLRIDLMPEAMRNAEFSKEFSKIDVLIGLEIIGVVVIGILAWIFSWGIIKSIAIGAVVIAIFVWFLSPPEGS